MAKQIEIQIPHPCHEDWNKMTIEAQGRYCNACQKTVIDFSLMSDEQLVNFFKKKQSHVCGRFSDDQLNKALIVPTKKIPWLTYFFQVSIPLFLLSLKATAQQTFQKNNIEITSIQRDSVSACEETEVFRTIKGVVKDLQDNPVAFASITIPGTQRGMATDVAGNFSIRLSGNERFIKVSCVGYDIEMVAVPENATDSTILIKLTRNVQGLTYVTAGGVTVRSTRRSKKKKEIAPVVCTQATSILIYPNPISLNSLLTIKWDYPAGEEQQVEIYNISGVLIQKENTIVNKYTNTTTVKLSLANTGNYIVKTTDLKTQKALATQLVVK
ncbi:MAG: carboxypeptidase-like regulatory domain-containing protein [Ferruginibacter sp.]